MRERPKFGEISLMERKGTHGHELEEKVGRYKCIDLYKTDTIFVLFRAISHLYSCISSVHPFLLLVNGLLPPPLFLLSSTQMSRGVRLNDPKMALKFTPQPNGHSPLPRPDANWPTKVRGKKIFIAFFEQML